MRLSRWMLPVLALAVLSVGGCDKKPDALELEGLQGTATWHVTIANPPQNLDRNTLQTGLEAVLKTTNAILGTWDPKSEISRFNDSTSTDWVSVSPQLAQVTHTTLRLSQESKGMYDVTVGPLLKLWGFQKGEPGKGVVPAPADIATAQTKVGYQKLQLRLDPPALRKSQPDLEVELASIADGFATDQAGEYLESQGIQNYMVEVAGEIRTRGNSPRGDAWRIAVEKPVAEGRVIQQGISLHNTGLATSGDYRNFFMLEGKRYSHTMNPVTGSPVQHQLASVSVLAESGLLADAYATLLMALGEDKGKAFAEQYKLSAFFIWRTDKGFETYATPSFKQVLLKL